MDVKYFPFDTQVKFIFVLVKHDKSIGIRIESLSPKYDIGQQKRSIFDKLEEGYYPVIPCCFMTETLSVWEIFFLPCILWK